MMIELLWLLLPVAAATGWLAGRRHALKGGEIRGTSEANSQDYYRGLSLLLNDEQDKALDVFLNMVSVSNETVETHLALGNLFRRRGEVDRAIRVHQNLIARPHLNQQVRADALFELAKDFMSAGLLGRAERVLEDLLETGIYDEEAYTHLVEIFEREKEWLKAIEYAKRCFQRTGKGQQSLISHYYCELALEQIQAEQWEAAQQSLALSLKFDRNGIRANMMLGELALDKEDFRQALVHFRLVEKHAPVMVNDIAENTLKAIVGLDDDEALSNYLKRLKKQYNRFSVIKAAMELIAEREGNEAARHFLREELLKRPSLKGLKEWAQIEMQRSGEDTREKIQIIVHMLEQVVDSMPTHLCQKCGYKGRQLRWQCPSCRTWGSITPISGAQGD